MGDKFNFSLFKHTQDYLLASARQSIETAVCNNTTMAEKKPQESVLNQPYGNFVTITIAGSLRGCIGCIVPVHALYLSIIDNAKKAALHDPRFAPLSVDELKEIQIEISILSTPEELLYDTPEDLLQLLNSETDGVILKKDGREATFLPQVWKQLPDKEMFLKKLSLKGNMGPNGWKSAQVFKYKVLHFSEKKGIES
ncbi:AmmeMemoRadiSam system protein A [Chitinispirillales bacterium ANBcel5]|uniref:AmmeMemoRadiSam system protein A n=1 Tax=Cellulosispirillum alkaliphilum TaxID=3039283 RepID=UPI002A53B70E|nr:AmmeMemoRadiSam system protein A [Chitinispirillales bacterium ANBcel5]